MDDRNTIDDLCQQIEYDKKRLVDNELEKIEVDSFSLSEFWIQFGASVQSLSTEMTKVSFMSGKKPYPDNNEMNVMIKAVKEHYTTMRDLYLVLPEEVGQLVYKSTTDAVGSIMASLLAVVNSLKDLSATGAEGRLTLMGTFWDVCNAVDKLPRNNLQACVVAVDAEQVLVNDAVEELDQLIIDDGVDTTGMRDNYEPWTMTERQLGSKATKLLRATQVCLKKLHKALEDFGNVFNAANIAQLDETAQAIKTVSPALDDVVCDLYHPVDFPVTLQSVETLVNNLQKLLSVAESSHYKEGMSKNVVTVLLQLINSSHQEIRQVIDNPIPELDNLTL